MSTRDHLIRRRALAPIPTEQDVRQCACAHITGTPNTLMKHRAGARDCVRTTRADPVSVVGREFGRISRAAPARERPVRDWVITTQRGGLEKPELHFET